MNGSVKNYDDKPLTNREFRALTARQKLEYMWKYKRIHVIVYVIELVVIVGALVLLNASNDNRLTGITLNNSDSTPAEVFEKLNGDFREAARKYSKKTKVEVVGGLKYYLNDESKAEGNYGLIQILVKNIEKGDLDFLTEYNRFNFRVIVPILYVHFLTVPFMPLIIKC